MTNPHAILGFIAGLLAIAAYIPYVQSIFKGETKPNRASFIIWSVVDIVLLGSYIASGARTTVWVLAVYCVFQLLVLGLSIRYGVGGLGKLDIVCLVGASLGLLLWIITHNAANAVYVSIFCEILGFLPTIRKVYYRPGTENTLAWSISFVATIINILAINEMRLEIAIYPIYSFIFIGIVAALLVFPGLRFRKSTT